MRTNIAIEDKLMEQAFKHTTVKTKKELVHVALREFVRNHGRLNLADLKGKITFRAGYDHKKMRRGKAA